MLNTSSFDHLVIAVPDLEEYVEQCEVRLGVAAVDGGAHPGLGTANALLGLELGDDLTESLGLARPRGANPLTYLEILGPDPEQDPALAAGRLAGITAPTVQRWAIRPDDFDGLVTAAARSREPRVDLGEVHDMTRRRPDGVVLAAVVGNPAVPHRLEGLRASGEPGDAVGPPREAVGRE